MTTFGNPPQMNRKKGRQDNDREEETIDWQGKNLLLFVDIHIMSDTISMRLKPKLKNVIREGTPFFTELGDPPLL